ncbi:3-oxoacyl-ACP reductase [Algiphilus sp.]|uniref:3-oxoacyl-ACP reductase n=2 Tax=Algiphilus sp. TaxID=1872431 RepID=UPI0025B8343B|nr:3-oxoacyl-ACP reductase [Algiphilus sp.]MCK5770368.1 3-oxoacyl-ACP reductase [Algiphilus sp.]
MTDRLLKLAQQPAARKLLQNIGLPAPVMLKRATGAYAAKPLEGATALSGAAGKGAAIGRIDKVLSGTGAETVKSVDALGEGDKLDVVVFDATAVTTAGDLRAVYDFFHPIMGRIGKNARVVVVTGLPEAGKDSAQSAAFRAMEGFTRSVAKEIGKRGATANLFYVEKGAEDRLEMPLRFFLTGHSAYVDGQPVRVTKTAAAPEALPMTATLSGKVALVTGAARGIGAATAQRLAAEGAQVIGLDIPQDEAALNETMAAINGIGFPADVTDDATPKKIADFVIEQFGGVDIVVHNAGVTRDKTLAKMPEHYWDMVLGINLDAILKIDAALQAADAVRDGGRVICLASIGGIAGNIGQTNYGATKSALIGYVAAEGPKHGAKGITVNAVAPGFIETRMTAAMPFAIREAGRRMNSMSQGGTPEDVAELICFLSTPGAYGVTGNTIRVCGQSLIGA